MEKHVSVSQIFCSPLIVVSLIGEAADCLQDYVGSVDIPKHQVQIQVVQLQPGQACFQR